MIRGMLVAVLAGAACVSVRIEADGTTSIRSIGAVRVQTAVCKVIPVREPTRRSDAEPAALYVIAEDAAVVAIPDERTCVRVEGTSLSEVAGNLVAGILRSLIGGGG